MSQPIKCKCGCGGEFVPSRSTMHRIKSGDDVGYLPGHKHRGAGNPRWKGGRFVSADGYVYLLMPEHPNALKRGYVGYVAEHRLVISKHLGRPLLETELVHHKNENKADNRLENLELTTRTAHPPKHFTGSNNTLWKGGRRTRTCVACKTPFLPADRRNDYGAKYCSRDCMAKHMNGENAGNVKLTDAEIREIRSLSGHMTQRAIAARFTVSKTQVGRILRGESR